MRTSGAESVADVKAVTRVIEVAKVFAPKDTQEKEKVIDVSDADTSEEEVLVVRAPKKLNSDSVETKQISVENAFLDDAIDTAVCEPERGPKLLLSDLFQGARDNPRQEKGKKTMAAQLMDVTLMSMRQARTRLKLMGLKTTSDILASFKIGKAPLRLGISGSRRLRWAHHLLGECMTHQLSRNLGTAHIRQQSKR
jgi:hypothetical protein